MKRKYLHEMVFFEKLVSRTELKDWKRSFEKLRVEIFVIDKEVQQIFRLEFIQYRILSSDRNIVNYFLEFIESSQPSLEVSIEDQIHNELQTFFFFFISCKQSFGAEVAHVVQYLNELSMIGRHGEDVSFFSEVE